MYQKTKSLVRQVQEELQSQLAIGQSKHDAKNLPDPDDTRSRLADTKIYSWETFRSYMRQCNYFCSYCKETHHCKTLAECRQYADEWLRVGIDRGLSPYTIKLQAAALAKLYHCRATDFIATPSRVRSAITRSRGAKQSDSHWSEQANAELVAFCRATGLRRSELETLRGSQCVTDAEGGAWLWIKGKGGRKRFAPIIGAPEVVKAVTERCARSGADLVWGKVSSHADIHSYRADYATAIYNANARPIEDIPRKRDKDGRLYQPDVYYCRGDMAGQVYDRAALLIASKALGHNRVSVVAEHYLRSET